MIELYPHQYESVRPLLNGLWYHLNVFAVIEGKCCGLVFADDAECPSVAMIWEQVEGNCYLAGDCANPETVLTLRSVVNDTIVPAGKALPGIGELIVNWHPDLWESHFETIFTAVAPMRHLRKHFMIDDSPSIDWRASQADGYKMQLVDDELLAHDELVNIDDLRNWGSGSHDAMKPLMGGGIGTAPLCDNHIVSWCMGDYAAGNAVEVGIHTAEDYRRKGLATLTTAAMVETCLKSGAEYVGWHCWSSNVASAKTACKVGFRQTIEHPVYHAWFNRVDNQFVRGNMRKFEYGDAAKAVEEYAIGFRMIDEGHADLDASMFATDWLAWAHYNMACAASTSGSGTLAFEHLQQAIATGYDNVEQLKSDPNYRRFEHKIDGNYWCQG